MNYWITTHWPPRIGNDPESIGVGVWLPDDRKEAGNDFQPGDKILIYQSRSGRPEVRTLPNGSKTTINCVKGKEGFVAICQALSKVYKLENIKPTKYNDGTEICWCWFAEIKIISKSGFLSREDANKILGYKSGFNYRGFGDLHSGLKKISGRQYEDLIESFRGKIETVKYSKKYLNSSSCGESLSHYLLKNYVACNPSIVLNEIGISKYEVEFPFPTGDRADILLIDRTGRIIGVEIEINVDDEYEGLLQAIKYRYMSEPMMNRKLGDSRAFLIAYSISEKMKNICNNYNVNYIEVRHEAVDKWTQQGIGLNIKKRYNNKN